MLNTDMVPPCDVTMLNGTWSRHVTWPCWTWHGPAMWRDHVEHDMVPPCDVTMLNTTWSRHVMWPCWTQTWSPYVMWPCWTQYAPAMSCDHVEHDMVPLCHVTMLNMKWSHYVIWPCWTQYGGPTMSCDHAEHDMVQLCHVTMLNMTQSLCVMWPCWTWHHGMWQHELTLENKSCSSGVKHLTYDEN